MKAMNHVVWAVLVTFGVGTICSTPAGAQLYFSDDFEDPAASAEKWEVITGEWEVGDGVYHQLSTASPWQAAMVAADRWQLQWQEYTIEFDVKIMTEGDAPVNILFRVQDPVPVTWDDRNGPNTHMYRWIVNGWTNTESRPYIYNEGTATMLAQTDNTLEVDTWHHLKLVVTSTGMAGYVNDVQMFDVQHAQWTEGRVGIHAYSGVMDFDNVIVYGPMGLVSAGAVAPEDGATDIPRDGLLEWAAGSFAQSHDVYLGLNFADVNEASRDNPLDVLVSQGQTDTTYDPGRLELGQTYYWRVDEVNAPPDNTIFKGEVWSFEIEPVAYPIENITATASSSAAGTGPENTINGSGLDENDLHSTEASDMWLSSVTGDEGISIEYTFDRLYKLHEMWVWNYNVQFESILGYGCQDVTVEYSEDGIEWIVLGDFEFAQATSRPGYAANTTVDFGGRAVRAVRLTINGNWGTMSSDCGLSEVRFLYVPVQARQPQPFDGATDVAVDAALSWRPGREAATHDVYLGIDSEAVSSGAAIVGTADTSSLIPGSLDLGATYYWRVDEVNEAEAVATWEGSLWSFVTEEFVTIEDFERFDDADNRIYDTWIDGWVNGTSSTVGYLEEPFAEQTVVHGGGQAMPLEYINAAAPYYSEAQRDLNGADWTVGGADTLRLYVQGRADNDAGILYLAIEDRSGQVAVVTYPDEAVLTTEAWQEWSIPFNAFDGVDFAAVQTIYIGAGDRDNPSAGGSGLFFVDDIQFGRPAQ